jgi:protein-S-isoprenylcysteine O-methyltransferase Ste14
MDRLQIPAEERALRALFGDEFVHYCSEVRRWL